MIPSDTDSSMSAILEALNSAFRDDPAAIHSLCCNRVPCTRALADHPTVQVDRVPLYGADTFAVGALGLLNGVIEAATGRRVAIAWSEDADADGRRTLLGFIEYTGPKA